MSKFKPVEGGFNGLMSSLFGDAAELAVDSDQYFYDADGNMHNVTNKDENSGLDCMSGKGLTAMECWNRIDFDKMANLEWNEFLQAIDAIYSIEEVRNAK